MQLPSPYLPPSAVSCTLPVSVCVCVSESMGDASVSLTSCAASRVPLLTSTRYISGRGKAMRAAKNQKALVNFSQCSNSTASIWRRTYRPYVSCGINDHSYNHRSKDTASLVCNGVQCIESSLAARGNQFTKETTFR